MTRVEKSVIVTKMLSLMRKKVVIILLRIDLMLT